VLDTDTKRRIDTARDILVGKVPDPKSQVEQITIALIYKFMDDMDAESEELGGKRKFFTRDFARYGWAKLMAPSLGGHEMLGLYGEGISKMPENPGIPALFRDIFKNAYLPYRDPETLKAFLKIINEFSYDHSERLGDAFEYLLSVLGSQGDAGQFRTPRHIIDFMVAVVAPRKNETILDPACGTAGFLISAYKHILRTNTDAKGHSKLTPDEKGRLAKNFKGYDISPDMVRLSLVNLYLHGFTDPHIFEYDTLTSEERWNEFADVILANPPFMSPKGGIKPHKRFSIQAKRSEVLFVDYMAEHLTPSGRAGIIVPEGIIFQSQTAYKDLRKMLVDNSLVAVVSLPAGCFNPYSGVKTSILFLDKSLARQSDTIAFFKVENDGFGLGAQRRAIEKNDLPQVQAELAAYLQALRAKASTESILALTSTAQIVPKEKIAANGDYNLSGERYREGDARRSAFPLRRFEEVCTLEYGESLPKEKRVEGPYPVVGSNGITGYHNEYIVEGPAIVVGRKGSAGEVTLIEKNCFPIDTTYYVKQTNPADSNISFLFWMLKTLNLPELRGGAGIPGLNRADVYETHQIPLPPLEVQKEIVAEIEGYQKVINGARAVLDHYRPHIPIHPDWPMVKLGDVCESILTGPFGSALHQSDYVDDGIPVINPANIADGIISTDDVKMVSAATQDRLKEFTVRVDDIIIGRRGEMGRCGVVTSEMSGWLCGTGCFVIRLKEACLARFAFFQIASPKVKQYLEEQAIGVTMKNLNQGILSAIQMPLPPLATQQAIVAEIEAEQALVAANRELITRFEQKIQATLARIWGEPAPAAPEA
jgi:type I restriction enzyme M protein